MQAASERENEEQKQEWLQGIRNREQEMRLPPSQVPPHFLVVFIYRTAPNFQGA